MTLILGHSADIIEANDCKGLAQLSEKRLECIHKLMRRFKERLSRKTKLADCVTDIFARLFLQSSPVIRAQKPKKQTRKKRIDQIAYPDDDAVASMLITN